MKVHATTLCRTALALLFGGVAPIEIVTEPCQMAPFHAAPATEREWLAATFDMRVHRSGDDGWIQVGNTTWSSDALHGTVTSRSNEYHNRPRSHERDLPPDSLTIAWNEIERIERPGARRPDQSR